MSIKVILPPIKNGMSCDSFVRVFETNLHTMNQLNFNITNITGEVYVKK